MWKGTTTTSNSTSSFDPRRGHSQEQQQQQQQQQQQRRRQLGDVTVPTIAAARQPQYQQSYHSSISPSFGSTGRNPIRAQRPAANTTTNTTTTTEFSRLLDQYVRREDLDAPRQMYQGNSVMQSSSTQPGHGHLQLDEFDLALLAHCNNETGSADAGHFPSGRGASRGPDHVAAAKSYQSWGSGAPAQVSPYFQAPVSKTSMRAVESSSSELEVGYPSSPLIRHQLRRAAAPGRPPDDGATVISSSRAHPSHGMVSENAHISVRGIILVSPAFHGDENLVLAAPTGSGKTVVMELAICRLLDSSKDERFKVIYQAPTKSLCAERCRDWNAKFGPLGFQCAELTGDTEHNQLKAVQNSQIIITTPEKWDSMTRKWKDHARLMQLVRLFLIDEVHILKEARGATLEAVVSRMKTIGSNVRFVALSATVPNSQDIAIWLGRDATNQQLPARREHFGEDFRPVKLQKFVYGYQSLGNDFAFDKLCSTKLPDVIATHSRQKPIMVFCSTRNSTVATAKELSRLWTATNPPARLWSRPNKQINVHNQDLNTTIATGVAFHHAGLDPHDRHLIETAYLEGHISIICCTSTLAVGVNLPCHLVIIKGTVGWMEGGCKEYSDLEMMQMLGRAGRPQFDDSAVAVILTRKDRVSHYEKLVSGSESVESCLHLNLIDHLNAEIGLGNVTNVDTAVRWLAGTFLFVRLRRNPTHYKLKEGANQEDEDEMLRQICDKDIKLLQECGLVSENEPLRSTAFGDAMARYYVRFNTMKTFLAIKPQARVSQILSAIAEADEFREVRLKAAEKSLYKELNRANGIRFPIKVDIALASHKVSLLIQAELGAVDFPDGEQFQKHKFAFQQDKNIVFSYASRLIRCIIDCHIHLKDSVAVKNALDLARSLGARVWDNSPLQMKQIEQIGIVAVRKFAAAGITSMEALELAEAHRIEMILSKNPPFGTKLLGRVADFPKLRVTTKMTGKETKPGTPVRVHFKIELGFLNEKAPVFFQRKPIYVCFLAETSDGQLIDFRRISAVKLQNGIEVPLSAELVNAGQSIRCYAMCDDIAGSLKHAELKPNIPASCFPVSRAGKETRGGPLDNQKMNSSRRRSSEARRQNSRTNDDVEIFEGDDLSLEDLATPGGQDDEWTFVYDVTPEPSSTRKQKPASPRHVQTGKRADAGDVEQVLTMLPNGQWACNHKCKDKTKCKHLCCREGLDKPPKPGKKRSLSKAQKDVPSTQLRLTSTITKGHATKSSSACLAGKSASNDKVKQGRPSSRAREEDMSLHRPAKRQRSLREPLQESHANVKPCRSLLSSDYTDVSLEDLPSPSHLMRTVLGASETKRSESSQSGPCFHRSDKGIFDFLSDSDTNSQPETVGDSVKEATGDANAATAAVQQIAKTASLTQSTKEPTRQGYPVPTSGRIERDLVQVASASPSHPCPKPGLCPQQTGPREKESEWNTLLLPTPDASIKVRHNQKQHDEAVLELTPTDVGRLQPKSTAKWEGIDPEVLAEFQDLVNFF